MHFTFALQYCPNSSTYMHGAKMAKSNSVSTLLLSLTAAIINIKMAKTYSIANSRPVTMTPTAHLTEQSSTKVTVTSVTMTTTAHLTVQPTTKVTMATVTMTANALTTTSTAVQCTCQPCATVTMTATSTVVVPIVVVLLLVILVQCVIIIIIIVYYRAKQRTATKQEPSE